jgi:membrane-associated phospholipid phosphatase
MIPRRSIDVAVPPFQGGGAGRSMLVWFWLVALLAQGAGCVSDQSGNSFAFREPSPARASSSGLQGWRKGFLLPVARGDAKSRNVMPAVTYKPRYRSRGLIEERQVTPGVSLVSGEAVAAQTPFGEPLPEPIDPLGLTTPQFPLAEPSRLSYCNDFQNSPEWLTKDIRALGTWENGIFLGIAAGGAAILHNKVDDRVSHDIEQHGPHWGSFSDVLSHGGDTFAVHVPLLAGTYITSLCHQDDDLHEFALALFSSYKFTVLSTVALQYSTGTHHTRGGAINSFEDSGFPSAPASTSFALAAVFEEKYGWKAGVPAYVLAGLIGWGGIDQHQHTVSDVVFGAALGYAIGKSIGASHYRPDAPYKLVPFVDSYSGTQGLAFERRY